MRRSARDIADNASFQAFMNSYLKEVDPGVWHQKECWQQQTGQQLSTECQQVLEIKLPHQNLTLALSVSYRSLVGRHTLIGAYQKALHQFHWQSIDFFSVMLLLVKEIYTPTTEPAQNDQNKTLELELLARLIESQQVMTRYLEHRAGDDTLFSNRFIHSEQSILFGHWLHPTPKSRQGIHEWQHQEYTPELCGRFQLHYFAVDRSLVQQGSILKQSAEAILDQILADEQALPVLPEHMMLVPTHPLQAQWLLHQPYIQHYLEAGRMMDVGPLGARFTPTSSVRTLYCESLDFMIKLSIPVKVTNSMRINMNHELEAGVAVASLFRQTQFSRAYPRFQTIDDPAYLTLSLPEQEESGFELIIRENPFSTCQPGAEHQAVVSLAALTQDSLEPDQPSRLASLIHSIAAQEQTNVEQVAHTWFEQYWLSAIEPAIRLYDEHGIALEAHQQNSLLDISQGYPSRYFYRDNQGFYLSERHKETLIAMEPILARTQGLFYDDTMIINRFCYYLIVNQLFSVINRLGNDQLLSEQQSLTRCVALLAQLKPQLSAQGKQLVEVILSQPEIAFKGNLLTRIHDVDELQSDQELAVYTKIRNPLRDIAIAMQVISDQVTGASINRAHRPLNEPNKTTTSQTTHSMDSGLSALISASKKAALAKQDQREVPCESA